MLGGFFKAAKSNEESDPALHLGQAESYLLTGNINSEDDPLIWWGQK